MILPICKGLVIHDQYFNGVRRCFEITFHFRLFTAGGN